MCFIFFSDIENLPKLGKTKLVARTFIQDESLAVGDMRYVDLCTSTFRKGRAIII